MDIIKELKSSFTNGGVVTRIIYVNVALFVIVGLLNSILLLTGFNTQDGNAVLVWLSLPASVTELMYKPWTIITYMFLQFRFLHLLVNMLMLYWFGSIFLQLYRTSQLLGVYLLGGIFGGLLYVVLYNLVPFYSNDVHGSILMGASGSVLAIIAAAAFGAPTMEIQLMFIGRVKLLYLGLFSILLDLLSITSTNAGGHIAHLGGALAGYIFVVNIKNQKDITRWLVGLVEFFQQRFQPRKKTMKVKWKRPATEQAFRDQKFADQKEVDRILDKIKKSGYESLSSAEKRKLFDAGK